MSRIWAKMKQFATKRDAHTAVYLYAITETASLDFELLIIDSSKGCIVYPRSSAPRTIGGGWFFRDNSELFDGLRKTFDSVKN